MSSNSLSKRSSQKSRRLSQKSRRSRKKQVDHKFHKLESEVKKLRSDMKLAKTEIKILTSALEAASNRSIKNEEKIRSIIEFNDIVKMVLKEQMGVNWRNFGIDYFDNISSTNSS